MTLELAVTRMPKEGILAQGYANYLILRWQWFRGRLCCS